MNKDLILANRQSFTEVFKAEPDLTVFAPGRLEILGNHTDYNEGYVLSTAVDRIICASFRKVDGDVCQVYSADVDQTIHEFRLAEIADPLADKHWTNYVRGVVVEIQKRNLQLGAFQLVLSSNVPASAGMSSSAALEMALVTGFDQLYSYELELKEKALIGQGCENNYIGANTGLMDQFTSLAGEAGQLVVSEYRHHELSHTPLPEGLALVVVNSGVKHDLSEEYNDRRKQCENVVSIFSKEDSSVKALRDVSLSDLEQGKAKLPEEDYRRALHVVQENARVHQAADTLKAEDYDAFGQLLFDSHASSVSNFENSCPELDQLVELAKQSPLCLGARLSGGGFGGITIHLVKAEDAELYAKEISKEMARLTGIEPETFVTKSDVGARVADLS